MSLALNPIKVVKVVDPVLDFDTNNYYAVLKGGQRTSFKPIISTSFSDSSCTFSAPPPNPSTAVDRHVKLKVPFTLNFTGDNGVNNLLVSGYDAFRSYPLSGVMNTLQLDLNNTAFSINMSDVIQGLLRYHNPDNLNQGMCSMSPSYMDQSQSYDQLIGAIRNPLGYYGDTVAGSQMARGGFVYTSFINTPTSAQITADLTEDLYLSPLLFGTTRQECGFMGLQTFQLTVNWKSDLSRLWSHAPSSTATNFAVSVTLGQPTLLFEYKTPSPLSKIPQYKSYPYYEIQRYVTDAGAAFSAGQSSKLSSSNIQLNSIPRMMYIFARKRNSDLTFEDTDTFFAIEGVSINWANNSGLLSNASQQDLYEMSSRNGCNLNWAQWSGQSTYLSVGSSETEIVGIGSVLAVEFGTDIGLNFDEAPGKNGTYQLQMEIDLKNVSADSITPALYVVISNEGVFTLENNSAYSQIGVISSDDIVYANKQKGINYNSLKYMAGASFFKSLKKGITDAFKFTKRHIIPTVKSAIPVARDIASLALMMGIGYEEAYDMVKR